MNPSSTVHQARHTLEANANEVPTILLSAPNDLAKELPGVIELQRNARQFPAESESRKYLRQIR